MLFATLFAALFFISEAQAQRWDMLAPMSVSDTYSRLMSPPALDDAAQREEINQLLNEFRLGKQAFTQYQVPGRAKSQCQRDMLKIALSMLRPKKNIWALKYIDAWAKLPPGVANGNFRWLGDFDECMSIGRHYSSQNTTYGPNYCLVGVGFKRPSNTTTQRPTIMQFNPAIMMGVCVPDSCKAADLIEILQGILPEQIHVLEQYTRCVDMNPPLDTNAIVTISIFSVVAFFLLIGLLVDLYLRIWPAFIHPKKTDGDVTMSINGDPEGSSTFVGRLMKIALCFSPLTNFEKIFKPPGPVKGSLDLSAINAIRALSLFWVVLGHTYVFFEGSYDNMLVFWKLTGRPTYQFVVSGVFAVDTFLFLSGFLAYWSMAKVFTKAKAKMSRFFLALPYTYIHRYIRLTTPYAAVILINLGLWRYLSVGPLYFQETDKNCQDNWWTNLLYVNNFVETRHGCVNWSWYMPVDMQLYILAPFVVYAFVRWPIMGWLICCSGLAAQIVAAAVLTVQDDLPLNQFPPQGYIKTMIESKGEVGYKNFNAYFEEYYIKPYMRMGPYIIGVMVCHLLVRHQNWLQKKIFSRLWLQLALWVICLGTMLSLVYGLADYYAGKYINPTAWDAIYNAVARIAWGLALGWLVLAATTKNAGIIGHILSWPVWAIPARLSYCGYLLHPLVIMFYAHTQRRPMHFNDITLIFMYIATIFNTMIVSTFLSLGFEGPVIGLMQRSG